MHLSHNVLSWAIQMQKSQKFSRVSPLDPTKEGLQRPSKTTQLHNSFSSYNTRQKTGNHKNC